MVYRPACRSWAAAARTRRLSPSPARSPANNGGNHARRIYRHRQYGAADAGQSVEEGVFRDGVRHRPGGDPADFAEAKPALDAMGANIIHIGAVGAGEVAKLCNNLIAGAAFVAVSEAFRIAEGFGVDPKILTQVISKSSGATWAMEKNHPVPGVDPNSTASRDYMPGFMTDLMAKDLGLAVNAARDKRVPVAVAAAAQQVYRMASAHGLGRKDCASVYRFLAPSPDDAPV